MNKQSVRRTGRPKRERPQTAPTSARAKPVEPLFSSALTCPGGGRLVSLHGKAEQLKVNAEKLRQSHLARASKRCPSSGTGKGKKVSPGSYVDRGKQNGAYVPGAQMGMGYNLGLTSPGAFEDVTVEAEKVTANGWENGLVGPEIGSGSICASYVAEPKIRVPDAWLEMAKSVGSTVDTSSSRESENSTIADGLGGKEMGTGELRAEDIRSELSLVQRKISKLSQQLCAHLSQKVGGDTNEKKAMNGRVEIEDMDDPDGLEGSSGSAVEEGKEAASSFLRDVPEVTSGQSAFVESAKRISPTKGKSPSLSSNFSDGTPKLRTARLQHLVSQLKAARVEDAHKIDSLNRENEKLRSKLKHAVLKAEKTVSLEKELELLRLSFEKSEKGRQAAKEYASSLKKELDALKSRSPGKPLLSSGRPKSAQATSSAARAASASKRKK